MWVIHPLPGRDYDKRAWDWFPSLADLVIVRGYTDKICFTGTEEQFLYVNDIIKKMVYGDWACNRCGLYDLIDLVSLLKRAEMVITVNTMTMHLAATLALPTVAIIGGTSADVVAPCDQFNFKYVENVDNINEITVDQVMEKIEELLSAGWSS